MHITVKTQRRKGAENQNRVWVDGVELDPKISQLVYNHSPDGFFWGYSGSGPAQTALAICLHIFGAHVGGQVYQYFKNKFVAAWPVDEDGEYAVPLDEFFDEVVDGPVLEIAWSQYAQGLYDRLFQLIMDEYTEDVLSTSTVTTDGGLIVIHLGVDCGHMLSACTALGITLVRVDGKWQAQKQFTWTDILLKLATAPKKVLQY